MSTATGRLFYHQDQLGSTSALTTVSGTVVAAYTYDDNGNQTLVTGTAGLTPFGFTGQYRDAESGLVYLRARYYNPVTGQFLTRDPAFAQSGSAYGYAGNDPINNLDPSGLGACLFFGIHHRNGGCLGGDPGADALLLGGVALAALAVGAAIVALPVGAAFLIGTAGFADAFLTAATALSVSSDILGGLAIGAGAVATYNACSSRGLLSADCVVSVITTTLSIATLGLSAWAGLDRPGVSLLAGAIGLIAGGAGLHNFNEATTVRGPANTFLSSGQQPLMGPSNPQTMGAVCLL